MKMLYNHRLFINTNARLVPALPQEVGQAPDTEVL